MSKYYIEINGYGEGEGYLEALMVGSAQPKEVFSYFSHPRVTDKSKYYISACRFEEEVLQALIKHFENYGYHKIKTKSFSVGY